MDYSQTAFKMPPCNNQKKILCRGSFGDDYFYPEIVRFNRKRLCSQTTGTVSNQDAVDWLILTTCQPVSGYLMPRGWGIVYFYNCCVVVSNETFAYGPIEYE